jgi:hypothetical protein
MPRCSLGGLLGLPGPCPGGIVVPVFREFLALFVLLGPLAGLCDAVEYRLRVANLYDKSFAAFIDGPIGLGDGELAMPRLEASLDESAVPFGALLGDRPLQWVGPPAVAAFGAVAPGPPTAPPASVEASGSGQWYEVAWSGAPGERTVWAVLADRMSYPQITQVALKGTGPLRYYLPYSVGIMPASYVAGRYPLGWLQREQERGTLWSRSLAKATRFPDGIAAVVGLNQNPQWADWIYFLVQHPAEPTTFKAVVAWERRRGSDLWDTPGRRDR